MLSYESLNSADPTLDQLGFANGLNLDTNVIVGEQIRGSVSNAIARVITVPTPSTVKIVYLTQARFSAGEQVVFQESAIKTNLQVL